jgi:mono/diheme cytochrome c family protein
MAATGSSGSVHIAPVQAGGAIVYWTTSSNTALKGFHINDKAVQTILTPASITKAGKATTCIGCHTSAPDGRLAFFGRADPAFAVDARLVDGTSGPPAASQVTANALANLARTNQDLPTLSKGHYSSADAVAVTTMLGAGTNGKWELVWTDLLAQTGGTGILTRTGDSNGAATPSWSHDGRTIVYTSSNNVVDGRVDTGNGDLWTVPYNNHSGGTAQALPGANSPSYNQYYPVYSPGDTFIAFNRTTRGSQMYNADPAEVFVVPAAGGTPTRLVANDPPACSNQKSPGLTNSWPRWAPTATALNGKHYYWLVFSSHRRPLKNPQLYLTAIVTKDGPSGEVIDATYPAIYITSQPQNENNHTPAWDEFMIPIG